MVQSFITCFIDGGDSTFSLSILLGKLYQTGPICCNISISVENISVENEQVVSNGIINYIATTIFAILIIVSAAKILLPHCKITEN